jgi:hypothetical protein
MAVSDPSVKCRVHSRQRGFTGERGKGGEGINQQWSEGRKSSVAAGHRGMHDACWSGNSRAEERRPKREGAF